MQQGVGRTLQGSAKRRYPDLANFITALAYHFCLDFPAAFTQPGAHLLAEHCKYLVELHDSLDEGDRLAGARGTEDDVGGAVLHRVVGDDPAYGRGLLGVGPDFLWKEIQNI